MNSTYSRIGRTCLVLLLVLSVMCNIQIAQAQAKQLQYAMVTDGWSDDIYDQFFDGTTNGWNAFANENGLSGSTYTIYYSESGNSKDQLAKVVEAIDDGANVIILGGFMWDLKKTIGLVKTYPLVCFLSYELDEDELPSNIVNLTYADEISGFLAGYAVVMDGYTQLGFLGGSNQTSVVRMGYEFIQGAEKAATELGASVSMKYMYTDSYSFDEKVKEKMAKWYTQGTEIVFSCCGSGIYNCIEAAEENYGYVIGVDNNEKDLSYTVISSAMKRIDNTTQYMLEQQNTDLNRWPSFMAGKTIRLSIEEDAIGLPTDDASWRFSSFSVDDYNQLLSNIVNGTIKVNSSISSKPKVKKVKISYEK